MESSSSRADLKQKAPELQSRGPFPSSKTVMAWRECRCKAELGRLLLELIQAPHHQGPGQGAGEGLQPLGLLLQPLQLIGGQLEGAGHHRPARDALLSQQQICFHW